MSTRFVRSVRLLAVLAVAAVALLANTPAEAAAPRPTTTAPARGAAGWLAQQFGTHYVYPGGTYFDGGSTADSIFALAAAKVGKNKINSAIRYFAKHVNDYTSVNDTSGQPGPYDGSVAKTAVAALVAGTDPTHFGGHNLLQALKNDQCTTASKPKNDNDFTTPTCPAPGAARNIYSSVSESLAILAEARGAHAHGTKYAPDAAALHYFLSLQCPNGGFTSQTSGGAKCASDPDSTGFAMMALKAAGHRRPALTRAAHWLLSVRNPDGSWTAQHVHNVDSTGLAAAALAGQGRDTHRSIAWLASQQVTTGPTVGKGASRGALKYHGAFDASSSIKSTADGLLGMVAHGSLATLTAKGAAASTPVLALAPAIVRHATVGAGRSETVTGTGFAAGEVVKGALKSKPAGAAKAGRNGTVRLTFSAPTSGGRHTIRLTGRRSGLTTSAAFTVRRAAAAAPVTSSAGTTGSAGTAGATSSVGSTNTAGSTGTAGSTDAALPHLADTGRDGRGTSAEVELGIGLVALGGLALVVGRRRTAG
jgi:hypothetical protein